MKKAFFFVFLALAVVLAGCQPIAPTDATEIDQLREQNQSLSQQLLESQRQILDLQSQVDALSTQVAQLPPAPIQEGTFNGLATEILSLLEANFASDNNIYTWGTHAARGNLIQMSVVDYWNEYVIPLMPDQQWQMLVAGEKSPSGSIDNFLEVYPQGSYVDFVKPGTQEFGNLDWQLLRLAFQQAPDGANYLVSIIHDNWVP